MKLRRVIQERDSRSRLPYQDRGAKRVDVKDSWQPRRMYASD